MIRLPEDATTLDEVFAFLLMHLLPDDQFRLMRLIEEYETESRMAFMWIGRREIMCELAYPHPN